MYPMTLSRSFVAVRRDPPVEGQGRVVQYLAVIERDGEAWGAYLPDLPGCVAVAQSREEVEKRPTVFAEDALAWALLQSGKAPEAREHSVRARRLGTRDPWILYHAGSIEAALGARDAATELLRAALATGLQGDPRQRERAEKLLAGS